MISRLGAMGVALSRRVFAFLTTVVLAAGLVVTLFALAPGDAIDSLPNSPEVRGALAVEWGLNGGFTTRVAVALGRLARADLGHSLTFRPGAPVSELVSTAFASSATLLLPALLLGVALGYGGALLRGTRARPIVLLGTALAAMPVVFAALAVVLGVNAATWTLIERGILEPPTWFALPLQPGLVRSSLAVLVLAMGSAQLGVLAARAGSALAVVGNAPFVEAERARGGRVGPLVLRHLIPPTAALLAAQLPVLFSGLLVVERAFSLPGAGTMFWAVCTARDWPVAAGLTLAAAFVVAAARLGAETLTLILDPRAREYGA